MARLRLAMDGTVLAPKARPKYNNKSVTRDGIKFDSKREARRYADLLLLERAGEISELKLQPSFDMVINGMKVCAYVADFQYIENGEKVVEDVKSVVTAKNSTYRLKNKLMKAVHGIDVLETF